MTKKTKSKYALGSDEWPGISKVTEEAGELQQVIGKLMAINGDHNHWSGNLIDMLEEEIADLDAALTFLVQFNEQLDPRKIDKRKAMKLQRFIDWHHGKEPIKWECRFCKAQEGYFVDIDSEIRCCNKCGEPNE